MKRNDSLVKNTFRGILIVNTVSLVSAIAAIMVDAIIIGQFLGSDAMAAMGLIQPVVLLCNLVGSLIGPGLGIVCTRYMGMLKIDRVIETFSTAITTMIVISTAASFLLFAYAPVIGSRLGANANDPGIVAMILVYLRAYSLGLPFFVISMALTGLMMLDNDRKLGVMSVFVSLISDVVFDLLNVIVFHGGMRGMALATSFSAMLSFATLLIHFLKKDRILRYRPLSYRPSYMKEVVLNSVPNGLSQGSNAIRNMFFNVLLLTIATKAEVSALSVANSIFSVITAVVLSFTLTTSTIISLFYGEEDKRGIATAFKMSIKSNLSMFSVLTLILLIFADFVVRLFLKSGGMAELNTAAFFVRCMIIQFLLMGTTYCFAGAFLGTKHLKSNYLLVILREMIFPVLFVIILGRNFGVKGVGAGFIVSGVFTLLLCLLIPVIQNRKIPGKTADFILLEDDFGSKDEDTLEASVNDIEGVTEVSSRVMDFYEDHEMDDKTSLFVSLFVEEMLSNVIEYGFTDPREKNADIRVVCTKDKQVIRIRDAGKPFDPLEWYKKNHPEDPASGLGIRMVMRLAKDVRYVPAMGLNNLMIIL